MSVEEAADSAVQLANANIVRAIQLISTERGHDPRDYVLVPYGGAGPLHAAAVAARPRHPHDRRAAVCRHHLGLWPYRLDFVLFESMTRRALVDDRAPAIVPRSPCRDA